MKTLTSTTSRILILGFLFLTTAGMSGAKSTKETNLNSKYARADVDVFVHYSNASNTDFAIEFHNITNGLHYWAWTNGTGGYLRTIPEGNYHVHITPNTSNTYYNYTLGCWTTGGGINTASFYMVYFGPDCNQLTMANPF